MSQTKVGWLIGSVFRGEAEVTEEMYALLVDHAENYLRAFGQISSWSEWQCLSLIEQKAFTEAGQRIEDGRNQKIAELVAARLERVLAKPAGVA